MRTPPGNWTLRPVVGGQRFEDIEEHGLERWLEEPAQEVSRAYGAIERHTTDRLRQWLREKHKVQGRGTAVWPNERLHDELGLVNLKARMRSLPWATA